ncbi:uncharacterized protein [Maniola hyperantus]|uniref:uncharacterized protein n=1 Tax=Aphantopus hyperantus TaxID=2795564 RepID=UPI0037486916
MKHIFGTLDEDDAVVFDEAIDSVLNNERKISSLVKENILVTNSIINNFNETFIKVQVNEHRLNEAIDKFSAKIGNLSITEDKIQLQLDINDVFTSLEMSILTLSFKLEDIINAIMFSSQNILHPSIITPKQLHRELIDCSRHLPQELELPVPLEISMIHTIMKISKVSSYYMKNKLIFVLQIPLVSSTQYRLYHNIPLPTPHIPGKPESFSLVIPSSKYIAMTIDKNHYFDLDDLNNCLIINYEHYICDVANVYATDGKSTCESELLSKVINKIPNQCETKFIYGKVNIWKKLNYNRWIFVQSEPSKIIIECQRFKIHKEDTLLGTGVLTLRESCIGYNKNTVLMTNKLDKNISLPLITFDYNLINDSCCNRFKFEKIKDSVSPIRLERIDLDNLKSQREMLNKNFFSTELTEEIPHIIKYGTHYSILTIIISIGIVGGVIYIVVRKIFKNVNVKENKLPDKNFENIELEVNINPKGGEVDEVTDKSIGYPKLKRKL